MNYGN